MTRRVKNRKDEIADTAIRLFLQCGVNGTSMRDIASSAGISLGNLYYHVKTKEKIIDIVTEKSLLRIEALRAYYRNLGNVSFSEALRKCISFFVVMGEQSRARILFLNREFISISPKRQNELMASVTDYIRFFQNLLDEGIRSGEFEIKDSAIVAFNVWALQQEWVLRRWLLSNQLTAEKFAEEQAEFILKSISARR